MTQPLFSIIMATWNAERRLSGALDSVLGQTFVDLELVVQDKESTDGTRALVEARASEKIYFESGPDRGVYDAWNKALDRARGEWLIFLGADDRLFSPHVLARTARSLRESDAFFAQGALALGRMGKIQNCINRSRCEIFRHFISGMPLLTPAVFFRRSLFDGRGFDPNYAIAGDFAFVAERLSPENMTLLPFVVSYMESGGLSSAPKHRPRLLEERRRVLEDIVRPRAAQLVDYCIATLNDQAAPLEDTDPFATEYAL